MFTKVLAGLYGTISGIGIGYGLAILIAAVGPFHSLNPGPLSLILLLACCGVCSLAGAVGAVYLARSR